MLFLHFSKKIDCLLIVDRRTIPTVPPCDLSSGGDAHTVSLLIVMSDSIGVESSHEHYHLLFSCLGSVLFLGSFDALSLNDDPAQKVLYAFYLRSLVSHVSQHLLLSTARPGSNATGCSCTRQPLPSMRLPLHAGTPRRALAAERRTGPRDNRVADRALSEWLSVVSGFST